MIRCSCFNYYKNKMEVKMAARKRMTVIEMIRQSVSSLNSSEVEVDVDMELELYRDEFKEKMEHAKRISAEEKRSSASDIKEKGSEMAPDVTKEKEMVPDITKEKEETKETPGHLWNYFVTRYGVGETSRIEELESEASGGIAKAKDSSSATDKIKEEGSEILTSKITEEETNGMTKSEKMESEEKKEITKEEECSGTSGGVTEASQVSLGIATPSSKMESEEKKEISKEEECSGTSGGVTEASQVSLGIATSKMFIVVPPNNLDQIDVGKLDAYHKELVKLFVDGGQVAADIFQHLMGEFGGHVSSDYAKDFCVYCFANWSGN